MRFSFIAALAQASFSFVAGVPMSARPVADLAVATVLATPVATTAPTVAIVAAVQAANDGVVSGVSPRAALEGRQGGKWRDRVDAVLGRVREWGSRLMGWGAASGRQWGEKGRQKGQAAVQAANEIVAGVSRRGAPLEGRQGGRWRDRLDSVLGRVRDAGLRLMGWTGGRQWGERGRQRGEAAVQAANEVVAGVSRRGALEGRQGGKWRERLEGWLARAREAGQRLQNWGDFGRQRGDAAVQAANEIVAGVSRSRRAVPVLAARDWRQDLSAAKSLASSVVSSAKDTASTAAAAAGSSTTTAAGRVDGECGASDQPRTMTVTVSLVLSPSLTTLRQPAAQTVLPPPAAQASAANNRAPSVATIVLASFGFAFSVVGRFLVCGLSRRVGRRIRGDLGGYDWDESYFRV